MNPSEALYSVGHTLLEQGRYEDAKHMFRAMMASCPDDERGWLGLGACHEGVQEDEIAARLYTLAAQATSSSVRTTVALARVLRRLDRDDEADAAYERAGELVDAFEDPNLADMIRAEGGRS